MAPGLTLNDTLAPQNGRRALRLPASLPWAHAPGCITLPFVQGACGGPASSQQFPESEKLPAGVRLALQMWLTGVQILSGWEARRNSALDDRAKGQAFICRASSLSWLTGHEAGGKPCPASSCCSPPPSQWDPCWSRGFFHCSSAPSVGTAWPRDPWGTRGCQEQGEGTQAAPPFCSQLCFCTSLSCVVLMRPSSGWPQVRATGLRSMPQPFLPPIQAEKRS